MFGSPGCKPGIRMFNGRAVNYGSYCLVILSCRCHQSRYIRERHSGRSVVEVLVCFTGDSIFLLLAFQSLRRRCLLYTWVASLCDVFLNYSHRSSAITWVGSLVDNSLPALTP